MNKDEFIERMAEIGKYSKKDNLVMLEIIEKVFEEAITNGEEIHIAGFGHLTYRKVKGAKHRFKKTEELKECQDGIKLVWSFPRKFKDIVRANRNKVEEEVLP